MASDDAEIKVHVETTGGYAVVTIDRPHRKNALTHDSMSRLTEEFERLSNIDAVRAIVLTGAGAFCAGIDLQQLGGLPTTTIAERGTGLYDVPQGMIRSLVSVPVPTIAAIDGPAIGLGMDLALACDVRIVGSNGWLMQGWARVGLVPATGGVMLLASKAPTLLWRMLADQPRLDGDAATQEGIAEKAEDALPAAIERASSLAQMSRKMLAAYVTLSRGPLRDALPQQLPLAAELQLALFKDGGFRRAVADLKSSYVSS